MTTLLKCYQKQTKLEANCTNITEVGKLQSTKRNLRPEKNKIVPFS